MSLRVVVDVFSGLPNPQVDLDGDEARAILGRLRPERRIDEGEEALPLAPPLGYRGVTFEQVGDVLDPTFRGGFDWPAKQCSDWDSRIVDRP